MAQKKKEDDKPAIEKIKELLGVGGRTVTKPQNKQEGDRLKELDKTSGADMDAFTQSERTKQRLDEGSKKMRKEAEEKIKKSAKKTSRG